MIKQQQKTHKTHKTHLYVVVRFLSGGGKVYVHALYVGTDGALEQPLDRALYGGALHLVLQVVAQDAVQLLHVLPARYTTHAHTHTTHTMTSNKTHHRPDQKKRES